MAPKKGKKKKDDDDWENDMDAIADESLQIDKSAPSIPDDDDDDQPQKKPSKKVCRALLRGRSPPCGRAPSLTLKRPCAAGQEERQGRRR